MRSLLTTTLVLGASSSFLASAQSAGSSADNNLQACLSKALNGDAARLQLPSEANFQTQDVRPYNRQYPYTPAAITYPKTTEEVSAVVECAVKDGRKVQARSGGHDYVNKCIGGADGVVIVDLKNFNSVTVDAATGTARIGSANGLKDVATKLHDQGERMIPHGTSATVGIGGHTLVGGFGPVTRRYGNALDVLVAADVVLANGTAVTASADRNADLFWAVRGAGQSFGIVTELTFATAPEPAGNIVAYQYNVTADDPALLAEAFAAWQAVVTAEDLSRDLFTLAFLRGSTLLIRGNFFGSRADFDKIDLGGRIPNVVSGGVEAEKPWMETYNDIFAFSDGQLNNKFFYSKSATVTLDALPSNASIEAMMKHLAEADAGADWWGLFDVYGGAANDPTPDATAFPHRNTAYYWQMYIMDGDKKVADKSFNFLDEAYRKLTDGDEDKYMVYAGYPNNRLQNPQKWYWGDNLPRLEQIKKAVDPEDVFSTPHGVKPAGHAA